MAAGLDRLAHVADRLAPYAQAEDDEVLSEVLAHELAVVRPYSHAQATETHIQLHLSDSTLKVQVKDNGVGIDLARVDQVRPDGQGLGLRGMEERVNILGGILQIDSKPGHGTRITAEIPLDPFMIINEKDSHPHRG